MHRLFGFLIASLSVVACTDRSGNPPDSARADSVARARQDSINRALPGYVVDSIRPVEEELRRFRVAVGGDSAIAFGGGARSRTVLIRRFVEAVKAIDTIELGRLALTAREFSDLIYPESPYTRPPYRQAPGLVWSQIEAAGTTGRTRLLRRAGGQSFQYLRHACLSKPEIQGPNRIWAGCTVEIRNADGEQAAARLFGSIVERDGLFKFVNYANDY